MKNNEKELLLSMNADSAGRGAGRGDGRGVGL